MTLNLSRRALLPLLLAVVFGVLAATSILYISNQSQQSHDTVSNLRSSSSLQQKHRQLFIPTLTPEMRIMSQITNQDTLHTLFLSLDYDPQDNVMTKMATLQQNLAGPTGNLIVKTEGLGPLYPMLRPAAMWDGASATAVGGGTSSLNFQSLADVSSRVWARFMRPFWQGKYLVFPNPDKVWDTYKNVENNMENNGEDGTYHATGNNHDNNQIMSEEMEAQASKTGSSSNFNNNPQPALMAKFINQYVGTKGWTGHVYSGTTLRQQVQANGEQDPGMVLNTLAPNFDTVRHWLTNPFGRNFGTDNNWEDNTQSQYEKMYLDDKPSLVMDYRQGQNFGTQVVDECRPLAWDKLVAVGVDISNLHSVLYSSVPDVTDRWNFVYLCRGTVPRYLNFGGERVFFLFFLLQVIPSTITYNTTITTLRERFPF